MSIKGKISRKVGELTEALLGLLFIGGCLFIFVFVLGGLLRKFGEWAWGL